MKTLILSGWHIQAAWTIGAAIAGAVLWVFIAWWGMGRGNRPNTSAKPKRRNDD